MDKPGASDFSSCSRNTYNAELGGTNASACVSCPRGTYSTTIGATSLDSCLSSAQLCLPGYIFDASGACIACGVGMYASIASVCMPCARGTFSASKSAYAQCSDSCPMGKYGIVEGARNEETACGDCPVGTYNSCSLTVTYLDGDAAACATRRMAELVSQQFSWASVTSSTAADVASGSNCSSRWDFSDVSIGALGGISLSQPAWLMQHVRWSMSCTSALTAGVTSLRGALTASAAQRLIGTLAVHIGGTATRTIDETGVVADHGVGVVLALQSATQGGAGAGTSVTARDTVTLQWSIQVEANVLVTTLGSRQTWTQLVSGIMGAVVAALSLFRLMFKVVERFADRIIHFVLGNCGRVCGCWRSQWAARQLKTGTAKGAEMKLGSVPRAAVTNLDKSRASRVEAARAGAAAPFTGPWVSNPVIVSRRPSSQVGQSHAAADVGPGCCDPKRVSEEAMVSIR